MVESGRVPGKGRLLTSIEKTVSAHTEKVSNECEYRKMVEFRRVPGKARFRASVENLSRGIPEKDRICVSTENGRIRASTGKS